MTENTKKTIFIVDDNDTNLTAAQGVLSREYRVIALTSALQLFTALKKFDPDLILLDVEMPGTDGFEAMRQLKANYLYSQIPVIFLTALSDSVNEAYGIELGAVDFIMKPFSEPVLLNRIRNHLDIDEMVRFRTALLTERTQQLTSLKNGVVFTLADVVESRDSNTGGHIERTSAYMKTLIDSMLKYDAYSNEIRRWDLESVISSARLHDIGKITIPDNILNKPDKLTQEEFDTIKTHPVKGEQMIEQMISRTGGADFLTNSKLFASYHHEKWDGSGYPHGLKEEQIPLQGRIMAIIDVYDALISERPYKKAFTHQQAVDIIISESGRHFDPLITDVFHKCSNEFTTIFDSH